MLKKIYKIFIIFMIVFIFINNISIVKGDIKYTPNKYEKFKAISIHGIESIPILKKKITNQIKYKVTNTKMNKYITTSLNVRIAPNINSKIIGILNKNDYIEIIGLTNNGWCQILYRDEIAYISDKYLSDKKIEEPSYIDIINNELSLIPNNIYNKFIEKNWNIKLSNKLNSIGLTDYSSKTIYFNTNKSISNIKRSVIHEFGHFVWFIITWEGSLEEATSLDDKLYEAYNKEKDLFSKSNGFNNYSKGNYEEYFAEAFDEYIRYPSNLLKNAPLTYEMINYALNCL